MRVVIADDHEAFRLSLRALLSSVEGVEVVGDAADGNSAIAAAASSRADVVVLDLHLPGVSGADVARRLTRSTPRPAVVVVSMDDRSEARARARRAGAFAFVAKGTDPDHLIQMLHAAFRSSQGSRDRRPMTPGTLSPNDGPDPADDDQNDQEGCTE